MIPVNGVYAIKVTLLAAGPIGEDDIAATVTVENSYGHTYPPDQLLTDAACTISIAGNHTASLPKKPYNIKFSSFKSILGIPSSRSFRALAGYEDNSASGMRTHVTYKQFFASVGHMITPDLRWAELWIKQPGGSYQLQGLYQISQRVKHRSLITGIPMVGGNPATGSYYHESYNQGRAEDPEQQYLNTVRMKFESTYPDDGGNTPEQLAYVQDRLLAMEAAIIAGGDLSTVIDIPSWARMYAQGEWFKDHDRWNGSTYFYELPGDTKVYAGPIWDVSASMNEQDPNFWDNVANIRSPYGLYTSHRAWNPELLLNPGFVAEVKSVFSNYLQDIHLMMSYIRKSYAFIKSTGALTRNAALWDYFGTAMTEEWQDEQIDLHIKWLSDRLFWLSNHYNPVPANPIYLPA